MKIAKDFFLSKYQDQITLSAQCSRDYISLAGLTIANYQLLPRPTCQMQGAVYHFSANHRLRSHPQIQRSPVEGVAKSSILSSHDLGSVIIVVRLSEDKLCFLLDDVEAVI